MEPKYSLHDLIESGGLFAFMMSTGGYFRGRIVGMDTTRAFLVVDVGSGYNRALKVAEEGEHIRFVNPEMIVWAEMVGG